MKFHHLGIACADITATLEFIQKTQSVVTVSPIVFDEQQNATLCMVETTAGLKIELISGQVVKNYVKKGIGVYHTCWQVLSIDKAITALTEQGAKLISLPKPAVLFQGRQVAFLHSPLGLMELLAAT